MQPFRHLRQQTFSDRTRKHGLAGWTWRLRCHRYLRCDREGSLQRMERTFRNSSPPDTRCDLDRVVHGFGDASMATSCVTGCVHYFMLKISSRAIWTKTFALESTVLCCCTTAQITSRYTFLDTKYTSWIRRRLSM